MVSMGSSCHYQTNPRRFVKQACLEEDDSIAPTNSPLDMTAEPMRLSSEGMCEQPDPTMETGVGEISHESIDTITTAALAGLADLHVTPKVKKHL